MAIYNLVDIETTDDGDLVIDSIGDFKIATPLRTLAQTINNIILTNKGELLTDTSFGANLQSFYGESNRPSTHQMMEQSIIQEVRNQGYIDLSDIEIDIVPIDQNEAALMVEIKGDFVDIETTGSFGAFMPKYNGVAMGYIYPFISGRIIPAT